MGCESKGGNRSNCALNAHWILCSDYYVFRYKQLQIGDRPV
jgi:hypothetical protein